MLSHFNKYSSASFPFLPFRKDLANRCYLFSRTEYLFSNRSAKQLPLSLWLKEERTIPACDKLTLLLWSESDPLSGDSAGVGNGEFSCRKRTFQALSISPKHALTSVVQAPRPNWFPPAWGGCLPLCTAPVISAAGTRRASSFLGLFRPIPMSLLSS